MAGLGDAFNDPKRMALMALGARVLQASARGAPRQAQGIGGVMSGFMGDLQGIQKGAADTARQNREDARADKLQERLDKKYEREEAAREKLTAALTKSGHANGDAKKPGGPPDYNALARAVMDTDPDMAIRLMRQAPKTPDPLRGKQRYMVTDKGLLDMKGDKPSLVPGLEGVRTTGQSPAIIQQTDALFQRMQALEPGKDPNRLWMESYKMAASKSGTTPQQAARSFYADTLKKMISHEMDPAEVQAAAKTVGGLTKEFVKTYGSPAQGGGMGGGMAPRGMGGGMGAGMGAPGPGPGGMGGGATPGPTPVAGMGAPIPRAAPVPDPGFRPVGAARGVSTPPPTPRPAPPPMAPDSSPRPGPGSLPGYAGRGGVAPNPGAAGAPAAPAAPADAAEAYYNFLKEKYPNRTDEQIRARVEAKYGV